MANLCASSRNLCKKNKIGSFLLNLKALFSKKNVSFPTDTQMLRFHVKKHTLELWRLFYLTGIDRIIFQNSLVNK